MPRRLGPKRASRIRKLFNLSKEDDVRQYVVRKPLNKEGKDSNFTAPWFHVIISKEVSSLLQGMKHAVVVDPGVDCCGIQGLSAVT